MPTAPTFLVAVEPDWPDAYRVNRYVRGASDDAFAIDALADLRRFPTWMWRNTEMADFVEWLRAHNEERAPRRSVMHAAFPLLAAGRSPPHRCGRATATASAGSAQ
jgi:erythromycin esterase-like protein